MKLEKLTDKELIEEFETQTGLGISDYIKFAKELLKRLKKYVRKNGL